MAVSVGINKRIHWDADTNKQTTSHPEHHIHTAHTKDKPGTQMLSTVTNITELLPHAVLPMLAKSKSICGENCVCVSVDACILVVCGVCVCCVCSGVLTQGE